MPPEKDIAQEPIKSAWDKLVMGRKCPECGLALCCQCQCDHSGRELDPYLREAARREGPIVR